MEKGEIMIPHSKRKPFVIGNVTHFSVYDDRLTEKDLQRARLELNETEETRDSCLRELRRRLCMDEKVKYRTDDPYLLRFLRVRKFDCNSAYKMIQHFYSVRKKHAQLFSLPPNLEFLLKQNIGVCTPYADEEGRIIFIGDFGKWNPTEISFYELLSLTIVIADVFTMIPRHQINGLILILDMKGLTAKRVAQLIYPNRLLLSFNILQGCYPWRIKAIIGVNCGGLGQLFYQAARPFVKLKIIERILMLGSDMNELHQHVNPAFLPKKYKGKLEDSECNFNNFILNNLPYLKYERSFGYNTKE